MQLFQSLCCVFALLRKFQKGQLYILPKICVSHISMGQVTNLGQQQSFPEHPISFQFVLVFVLSVLYSFFYRVVCRVEVFARVGYSIYSEMYSDLYSLYLFVVSPFLLLASKEIYQFFLHTFVYFDNIFLDNSANGKNPKCSK